MALNMANQLLRFSGTMALCALVLAGCAAIYHAGVMPESDGNYSLTANDRQPYRSSLTLSAEVRQRAELWCSTQGLQMIIISETHSGSPLGNTAKIVFKTSKFTQKQAWGQSTQGPSGRTLGTGLVVSDDGLVLTSLALVEGVSAIKAYDPESRNVHSVTLVDKDATAGLALVKLANWRTTRITEVRIRDTASSGALKAAEALTIYGFPQAGLAGQTPKSTTSNVSEVSGELPMANLALSGKLDSGNVGGSGDAVRRNAAWNRRKCGSRG